jgi:DNA-directed RNA polymerase
MLPADRPQDLYASVAELVAQRVAEEAKQDGNDMAKLLLGKVSRKVIKQTVMTSVYGVTFIGARAQIRNAIKDVKLVDEEVLNQAALYVARLTFDALRQMFFGAKAIMEWLSDSAVLISRNGRPVTWVTPMGLPVVQPYVKPKTITVETLFQSVCLFFYLLLRLFH